MNRQARFIALSFLQKRARGEIIDSLVDENSLMDFLRYMETQKAGDIQRMAEDVYIKLQERLQLSDRENEALNRLLVSIKNYHQWDLALIRNNIFKAGDSLGIKLPHSIFAAKRPGIDDAEIEMECTDVDAVLEALADVQHFEWDLVNETENTVEIIVRNFHSSSEIEEEFLDWVDKQDAVVRYKEH